MKILFHYVLPLCFDYFAKSTTENCKIDLDLGILVGCRGCLNCGGMPKSTRTEHLVSHSPSNFCVLTTRGTYGTPLNLVLWFVLAPSHMRPFGVALRVVWAGLTF